MSFKSYKLFVVAVVSLVALAPRVTSAAPFVNLDFEQAIIPPGTPMFDAVLPVELAFPGWTARFNETVLSTVGRNSWLGALGGGGITLYDFPNEGLGLPVFQGTFSAALMGQIGTSNRLSLSQVGDVPADARSLTFLTAMFRFPTVRINGLDAPLTVIQPGSFSQPFLLGVDVSDFAGQTIEFRVLSSIPAIIVGFDDFQFSNQSVPEPGLGIAFLLVLLARRSFVEYVDVP